MSKIQVKINFAKINSAVKTVLSKEQKEEKLIDFIQDPPLWACILDKESK